MGSGKNGSHPSGGTSMSARVGWVAVLLIAAAATPLPVAAVQDSKSHIHGKITKVTPATDVQKEQGTLATIMIEAKKTPFPAYDKASVRITNKTKLWKQVGDKRQLAAFADLKTGTQVSVQFTGPVLQSYPVQATAGEVVIYNPEA
jgi:hypothetical protein